MTILAHNNRKSFGFRNLMVSPST